MKVEEDGLKKLSKDMRSGVGSKFKSEGKLYSDVVSDGTSSTLGIAPCTEDEVPLVELSSVGTSMEVQLFVIATASLCIPVVDFRRECGCSIECRTNPSASLVKVSAIFSNFLAEG